MFTIRTGMVIAAGVFAGGAAVLGMSELRREARGIEQRQKEAAEAAADAVVAEGRARLQAKAEARAAEQKTEERRIWEEKIAVAAREFAAAWADERNWDAERRALLAEHRKRAVALGDERPVGVSAEPLIEHLGTLTRAAARLNESERQRRR